MVNRLFSWTTLALGAGLAAGVASVAPGCNRDPAAEAAAKRAADPIVGVWQARLRPDYVGHLDPNFMPIYIFKPSGDAVVVNIKMATEDPGVWRRDAEGRLTLKLDSESGSRRLSEDGELLNVADPPGAVFPGPGTALWRVSPEKLPTRLAEIEEMERRIFGPRPPAAPASGQP